MLLRLLSQRSVVGPLALVLWLSALYLTGTAGVRPAHAAPAGLSGVKSVCPTGGDYGSLTNAFSAIMLNGLDGPLTLELCASYGGSEVYPLTVRAFPGSSATNTVTVRPAAGATGLRITSNAIPTLVLDNATYVIFDGRPGGVGSSSELTIENTGVYTAVSLDHAAHNTLQYLTLKGVGVFVVWFYFSNDNVLDRSDVQGSAELTSYLVYGYADGTGDNTVSNNRLHRFYSSSMNDSAGVSVLLDGNSAGWTITGNSIYQDAARQADPTRQYGIRVAGGDGHVITDNIIGGSQPNGGGPAWRLDTSPFDGIYLAAGAATTSTIQGNTIANMTIERGRTSSSCPYGFWDRLWSGITVGSGAAEIISNTIGSSIGASSVQVTSELGSTEPLCMGSYGILKASSAAGIIANNTVGAITVSSASTQLSHGFVGIATTGAGNTTITGNTVGSLTTADSIQNISPPLAAAYDHGPFVRGIESYSSGTTVISGNTVANLSNLFSGVYYGAQTAGIRTRAGANTITGNIVRNLTSNDKSPDTDDDATLAGIVLAATTGGDQVVTQNEVFALTGKNAYQVFGIYFSAPTTATNQVSRNFVHSIEIVDSPNGYYSAITGIYGDGTGVYQNNLVRLGVNAAGAAILPTYRIYGIRQAAAASFYYNSVYIGGGPVIPLSNNYYFPTYAFYGSTAPLILQNNLLINARPNRGSQLEWSYAAHFATTTDLTSDYNVYLAPHGDGTRINDFTDPYQGNVSRTLAAWQIATGQDAHSFSPSVLAQVNFVNATGDAASVDLRVQSPTVAEAAGVDIPGITDDYAGQVRAGLSPVDIGAYAGDWSGVSAPPVIGYTALPTTTTDLAGPTLTPVTVTAAAGVAIDPGTRPRLYFKRATDADTFDDNTSATNGWKWVEAAGSGDSPFSFTLDYSLVYDGSPAIGDTIQYFVIAQTLATPPGVAVYRGVLGGATAPAGVALAAGAFPMTSIVDSSLISGLSGVKTVCASGCDYASLTLAGGLFAAINLSGLGGDLIAEIRGDLTAETGATRLNQWADQGGGPWPLTIRPAGGAARTVSGSAAGLIMLNGADRVTIDGLNSDGNSLLIRNTNTSNAATIVFTNDASHNTVRNCTIEGATSNSAYGVVWFGTAGTTGNGNDNNTIAHNVIRDRSDTTGVPKNLIYSSGTTNRSNSGNVVRDNTLKNFSSYGIYIYSASGNADWTISGNTIFQEAARAALQGIYFNALGTNTISGNTIRDMMGTGLIKGIYMGDARATAVSGNRITLAAAGSANAWYGIDFRGASGQPAAVVLTNNEITIIPATSASQAIYGISDSGYSGNTFTAFHNSVYIGGTAAGGATWAFQRISADAATLKNNIFINDRTGGSVDHFAAGNQSASGSFASDYNLFAGTGATAASFLDWGTAAGGTPADFATWRASSGGDSHSYADVAADIPAASLFTDAASGDLRIVAGSGFDPAPLPSNRGVAGIGVTDDYSGTLRSTTMPDLGAFEFTVDRTGLAGPGTLAGGWGYYDTLGIASGAVIAGDDINVVDLSMSSGATLDMGSHTLNVAGAGNAHSEQQDVTGDAGFTFLGPAGVGINPGGGLPLGLTSVTIRFLGGGTTSCVSGGQTTVQHCFQINPVNPTGRNATVRFYFDADHDLNGLACAELKAYHYDGGGAWSLVGGTGGTVTCDGAASYVEATGVTDFSPFVLAAGQPNALTLRVLRAAPTPQPAVWAAALALLAVVIGMVQVGSRRMREHEGMKAGKVAKHEAREFVVQRRS